MRSLPVATPSSDTLLLSVADPTIETLSRQDTQLNCCRIESTAMFRRVMNLQTLDIPLSPDGKLLYMRSGKEIIDGDSILSIANGYIFSLDPNTKPELPAEIQLDDCGLSGCKALFATACLLGGME